MSVCTETYEGIDGIYGLSLWWGRGGWSKWPQMRETENKPTLALFSLKIF